MTQNIELIQLKRGVNTSVVAASLEGGEPAVALDKKELWVGDGIGKIKITDVYFYNSVVNFPSTGEEDKLYITKDTGAFYIWDPSVPEYKKYEMDVSTSLVYCRARGSVQLLAPSSYQGITFPTLDVETDPTKLYQDITNRDRFYAQESGYYKMSYGIVYDIPIVGTGTESDINAQINARFIVNGSNPCLASYNENGYNLYYVNRGITDTLLNDCVEWLDAGDYVSVQFYGTGDPVYARWYDIEIYKLDFVKGDQGLPGSPGSVWHNGTGIPLLTLGENNDHYMDNATGDVYYKSSGSWSVVSNIVGPQGVAGAAIPLPAVQLRRTTTYAIPVSAWGNLAFDTTDVETDSTIIEHDNTNTDRVLIKDDGVYLIGFTADISDEGMCRVIKNGTTLIPGSQRDYGNHTDAVDLTGPLSVLCMANLVVGDYLTVQLQAASTAEVLQVNSVFVVTKMQGPKGDTGNQGLQGPPGEAFTIDEYDDFDEAKITSIESGSGASPTNLYYFLVISDIRSNQTLPSSLNGDVTRHVIMWDGIDWYDFGPFTGIKGDQGDVGPAGADGLGLSEQHYAESETAQQTTNDAFDQKLKLSTSSLSGGTYRIQWYYEWKYSSANRNFKSRVQIDDTTIIAEQSQEPKDAGSDIYHSASGFKRIILSAGIHTIDIDWCCQQLGDTATIRRARIEMWRTS